MRVSFILPTLGRPNFLKKALKNLEKIISPNDELIVVDGSEDDSTYKLISNQKGINIKYFKAPETTECYKMNIGILNSKGKIIKPISDDDYIYPHEIKYAIQILEKDDKLDALQCGGKAYILKNGKLKFLYYKKVPTNINIENNLEGIIKYNSPHIGLIFKRRIIPKIGLYDVNFIASDIYLMSRMINTKINLKYLDICMYKTIVYPHSTDIIQNKDNDRDRSILRLRSNDLFNFFDSDISSNLAALGLDTRKKYNEGFFIVLKINYKLLQNKLGKIFFILVRYFFRFFDKLNKPKLDVLDVNKRKAVWTKKYW